MGRVVNLFLIVVVVVVAVVVVVIPKWIPKMNYVSNFFTEIRFVMIQYIFGNICAQQRYQISTTIFALFIFSKRQRNIFLNDFGDIFIY